MATEIHRWRSATGDPLLAASWDSGVAPGVASQADLTFTAVALNNETVTIAGIVYTFKTSINNGVAREVYHGATAADSAANLAAAINAGAGAGTAYSTATIAHRLIPGLDNVEWVIASNPSSDVTRAISWTLGISSIAPVSETSTVASWSGSNLSGGLQNWSKDSIVVFDGVSTVACQGTDRLDQISFLIRQTVDAIHDIGSPSQPLQWNHWGPSGQHILEGGGNVYLAHGHTGPDIGTGSHYLIRRLPNSYLEFQKDSGDLVSKIVEFGIVSINQVSGQNVDPLYVDGFDAQVTIVSGKPTIVWSRAGIVNCDSLDIAAADWTILGGVVQNQGGMNGARVIVTGGVFIVIPASAPAVSDVVSFIISGGILDLSQSGFEIVGRIVLRPGGTVIGGVVNPEDGWGGVAG